MIKVIFLNGKEIIGKVVCNGCNGFTIKPVNGDLTYVDYAKVDIIKEI